MEKRPPDWYRDQGACGVIGDHFHANAYWRGPRGFGAHVVVEQEGIDLELYLVFVRLAYRWTWRSGMRGVEDRASE